MPKFSNSIKTATVFLTIVLTFIFIFQVTVFATPETDPGAPESGITYIDEDGSERVCTDYKTIDSEHYRFEETEDTWLVFDDECTELDKLELCGDGVMTYHLILKDDSDVLVKQGIQLMNRDTSLTIYSQIDESGQLTAGKDDGNFRYNPGIGAVSGRSCDTITINGGNITAWSGRGAGIGTGSHPDEDQDTMRCTKIVINGGNIEATSVDGAGIGGGAHRTGIENIEINGGYVTATSTYGAGIGSGRADFEGAMSIVEDIMIRGGVISAESTYGAGIGSGHCYARHLDEYLHAVSKVRRVTINGGSVNATSTRGDGIGAGDWWAACESITVNGYFVTAYSSIKNAIHLSADCPVTISPICTMLAGNDAESAVEIKDVNELIDDYVKTQQAKAHYAKIGFFSTKGTWKDIIPPAAKVLTCSLNDQELVEPGSVKDDNGTDCSELFRYSLDGVEYQDTVPSARTGGKYKVYYKIEGNANYYEYFCSEPVEVTINHVVEKHNKVSPSETKDGCKEYYRCMVCDRYFEDEDCTVEIEDIEAWMKGPGKIEKRVNTGDDNNVLIYIIVMILAALVITSTAVVKKVK